MNILFVYPNVTRQRSPQIGIAMLAGVARNLGHKCELFDLTLIPKGDENSKFMDVLRRFDPALIAVSCRSNEWSFIKNLFKATDVGNALKVFGGPHVTVAPNDAIEIADVIVIGEGEETFSELLTKLGRGEDIAGVAGCWIRKDNGIAKNEIRTLIPDLDILPLPYWELFDSIHYKDSFAKQHLGEIGIVGAFEGSRGCPYACTYCTNDYIRTLYEGKGRWRREKSPSRIIGEIEAFRNKYGLGSIYWVDEIMLTDIGRLKEFRDLYISRIKVPFIFMERPENMSDDKVSIIRDAGAKIILIGIESGDEDVRKELLSRQYSQERIVSAFATARKYGLMTYAFTMVGFPGETRQSYLKTYRLLLRAKPDRVQTTIFYPLKKTKLFELVVRKGLFDQGTPMPTDYYNESLLKVSKYRKSEIKHWQYIFSNYKSRIGFLLIGTSNNRLLFSLIIYIREMHMMVYGKIKEEGLRLALKAIGKNIVKTGKVKYWLKRT